MRVISVLLVLCSLPGWGQSTVLKAMQDEIQRGMEKLVLKDHSKAFYMFCRIEDQNVFRANASYGAIVNSNASSELSLGNFRVLCGSYNFNDESLRQSLSTTRTRQIAMPEDTSDYLGIRRSIWATMENIYMGAAKSFAKNQETLDRKGGDLDQLPHKSFGKSTPAIVLKLADAVPMAREQWERKLRTWSDSLAHVSGTTNSNINLSYANGYTYMCSSEGTLARLPRALADLRVFVTCKNTDGVEVIQNLSLMSSSPSHVMDDQLFGDLFKQLKSHIGHVRNSKSFRESYSGPILFVGEAAARAMLTAMLDFEQPLMYSDDIKDDDRGDVPVFMPSMAGRETKMGTMITHPNITVKVDPSRTSFENTELLGGFAMDTEGTLPVPLTLIENGALHALMNDRTITSPDQSVNGYAGSIGGVVEVTVKNSIPEADLKNKLMEEVKKEGLEYGMLVRQLAGGSAILYKIFPDGTEEQISPGMAPRLTWKSLRKLLASSNKLAAYNVPPAGCVPGMDISQLSFSMMNAAAARANMITSVIVPSALLVGDIDLKPTFQRNAPKEYVSRPD